MQPSPVLLLGEFHGQRSLAGYSPWGHKELDVTERLTVSLHLGLMSPALTGEFFASSATWEDHTEPTFLKIMKNYINVFSNDPNPNYG